jgi:polyhydroxyalkanoate synthesis regulator phasin
LGKTAREQEKGLGLPRGHKSEKHQKMVQKGKAAARQNAKRYVREVLAEAQSSQY